MLSIKNGLIFTLYINLVASLGCEKVNSCAFKFPSGTIDLKNMKPTSGIFTAYMNNTFGYFYHPCKDVLINSSRPGDQMGALWYFQPTVPTNVTLNAQDVLNGKTPGTFTFLASADTAKCHAVDGGRVRNSILYQHNELTSEVLLVCDDTNPAKLSLGLSPSVKHSLELRGKDACETIEIPKHLSGGSVFVILFFTFSFLYCIGGGLILKYFRGAQGFEMIPNFEFWRELPSLVMDGVKFVCCRGASVVPVYDQI